MQRIAERAFGAAELQGPKWTTLSPKPAGTVGAQSLVRDVGASGAGERTPTPFNDSAAAENREILSQSQLADKSLDSLSNKVNLLLSETAAIGARISQSRYEKKSHILRQGTLMVYL